MQNIWSIYECETFENTLVLIKEIYPFLNHELNHLLKIRSEKQSIILFDKNKDSINSLLKRP